MTEWKEKGEYTYANGKVEERTYKTGDLLRITKMSHELYDENGKITTTKSEGNRRKLCTWGCKNNSQLPFGSVIYYVYGQNRSVERSIMVDYNKS
jgi:hypothetical protein